MTDAHDIVYPASEAVLLTKQEQQAREAGQLRGITFGTSRIDKELVPMMPGDLGIVCGLPSNGKSLLLKYWTYRVTQQIMGDYDEGDDHALDECAVIVTWEDSVEKITRTFLAKMSGISVTDMLMNDLTETQWTHFNNAVVKVGAWPLYIVGHSTQRAKDNRRTRPNLTPETVSMAFEHLLNDRMLEPRVIAMDYLQRIHGGNKHDRRQHQMYCVDWAKDTALQAGCPVLLGSQAGRHVEGYKRQIPKMQDAQETSNVEQSAQHYFGVWMPKVFYQAAKYNSRGMKLNDGDRIAPFDGLPALEVTDTMLILKVWKQKEGEAPLTFPMYVEPDKLIVEDLDIEEARYSDDGKVSDVVF